MSSSRKREWLIDILLVLILVGAACLRFTGVNWDQGLHAHPDERFLTMVETAISPVKSLAGYFDTAHSSLNPSNYNFSFFVYGTLPVFLVRYVSGWLGQSGFDQVYLVGRVLSGIFDLLAVLFVYLIGARAYNRRVGVLAAAFSALAVLQIQLSHYFVVDTFTTFFTTAAIYTAVRIMDGSVRQDERGSGTASPDGGSAWNIRALIMCALFGIALGMAVASKLNAAAVAFVLPVAVAIRISRAPRIEWLRQTAIGISLMLLAAVLSLIAFRVFQPYAFSGPGFFGLNPNPDWLLSLKTLSKQSTGTIDSPPELQWTNRPAWFALYNQVAWGIGWPLGILAWAGFLWMGWRIFRRGEWREHLLLWLWTGLYFLWQSLSFTKTMRYLLPVYPTLEVIAAWAVVRMWDKGWLRRLEGEGRKIFAGKWLRIASAAVGAAALVGSGLWAVAFTSIYTRPNTWYTASQWIYQNVPGAIELPIQTAGGTYNQQLAYRNGAVVSNGTPLEMVFRSEFTGLVTEVDLPHVLGMQVGSGATLTASIGPAGDSTAPRAAGSASGDFPAQDDPRGGLSRVVLDQPFPINAGQLYSIRYDAPSASTSFILTGPGVLGIQAAGGAAYQALPVFKTAITPESNYTDTFTAQKDGVLTAVQFPHLLDLAGGSGEKTLRLSLASLLGGQASSGTVRSDFAAGKGNSARTGQAYQIALDKPFKVTGGQTYKITLAEEDGEGQIVPYSTATAIESDWDVPLPFALNGYPEPWDEYNGIYQWDLNYQAYYPDDPKAYQSPLDNKLNRFLTTLDQSDYIFIASNRQYATTTRVPERYPLTTAFYRSLLGCPPDKAIAWCYSNAAPGEYQGSLGFNLVKTFQSNPAVGPFQINDQGAEEAFTVYDHPKVLIFKKNSDYSQASVAAALSSVDLSHVQHILPNGKVLNVSYVAPGGAPADAPASPQPQTGPKTLMLPPARLAGDQAGGTWSALFNRLTAFNQYPGVGAILWYLAISLLGWVTYPVLRLALPGLSDRGYPMARMTGLLLLAIFSWLTGSFNIAFTRISIAITAALIAVVGLVFAAVQRRDLAREWRDKKKYFLWVEIIALAFFIIDLLIRYGNPDLWHPAFGGEKPMDFSFLNAVIKSSSFPPYDPWFAGGYINYYYYGFVIFGVPVKLLGIIPSIAYNLILPMIYSLLALGAFSLGWNLINGLHIRGGISDAEEEGAESVWPGRMKRWFSPFFDRPFQVGLAAIIGFQVLGNLGTLRMEWYGIQKLVAPNGAVEGASFLQHWIWTFQGLPQWLAGARFPYYPGDWYWIPSRVVIPTKGNEITEFPLFTILYADPHAHLFALPVTLLVIGWALSIVLACAHWGEPDGRNRWLSLGASFFVGAMALGALRPSNTWDFYTYALFASIALVYAILRYYEPDPARLRGIPRVAIKLVFAGAAVLALVGLSMLLYQPFSTWFLQGYTSLIPWDGNKTPFWSYLTHWGLFLFVIVSWMAWETREWMASTPMSALRRLRPYQEFIDGAVILLLGAVVILLVRGIEIAWLALPLAVWAGVLMLRPNLTDSKRFVLFLTGTALVLTLAVELVVVKGDIGRQNTIFKFYFQAWTMFAVSAAAALGWLIAALPEWHPNFRWPWSAGLAFLVFSAALFPITATRAKIEDRMDPNAPHTLDGMTYMATSHYTTGPDNGPAQTLDLSQDFAAIRWMQDNVQGSPVIVEANQPQYRWGTRFTIYTGLPGVVGWEWHEQQQRSVFGSDPVGPRVDQVAIFYSTPDLQYAETFLKMYNVRYIILGQLEKALYPQEGLAKFEQGNGTLWKTVYHQGDTTIYEVNP